jgi:uncharacterized protein (DUF2147 family)
MHVSKLTLIATLLVCLLAPPSTLPAGAASLSPVGAWQSSDGLAQVKVIMCGDGTQLCALLTSVSGAARTPGNLRLLNNYVVAGAARSASNSWRGTVHFDGNTAQGDITLVSSNAITLNGCKLGMCKSLLFKRI